MVAPLPSGWGELAAQSDLARTDWNQNFQSQVPSTGWWNQTPAPFSYGPDLGLGESFDYDPGGIGTTYSPTSSLTMRMIDSDIDSWLRREHPELYDFTTGVQYGGVAGVGKVGVNLRPGVKLGYFTPDADAEIQAAANKYGVPANFLKAIIHKESSGNWDANSHMVCGIRGKCIFGYVGVFDDAAASWGFNFNSLEGNRAGQIEMLASGLRGMYDRLHAQNPQWGWLNVAANHYSGDPTGASTPGDSWQHGSTQNYMDETKMIWQGLDSDVGNTWSNYTDTRQNTGVGSPQNQAWGPYAQWDQAIVGLSANQGAPANLLKAFLRYGDESGRGYSTNFDTTFSQAANTLTANYRQTGDWGNAIALTLGVDPASKDSNPAYRRVKQYWDELNADMSGVFGGQARPGATPPGSQAEAIWGGIPHGISQRNGPSDFANQHPDWYEYSVGVLGTFGHPGDDVTIPEGTILYAPQSGTVIRDGNTGSYAYGGGDSAHSGELRIRLDNGDELILGHTKSINVRIGDRVTPGQQVAISGWAGTGDHLHLEYRTPDPSMSSGWRSIDPFPALSGQFTGFHQGARTGLGYTTPMTFKNLMLYAASGKPIPSGATFAQGGGRSAWSTWLRNTMLGIQNQEQRAGQIDYGSIYNLSPGGIG